MQKIAIVVSLASAAVAGGFAWETASLRGEVRDLKATLDAQAPVEGRLADLERAQAKAAAAAAAPKEAEPPKDAAGGAVLAGTGVAKSPEAKRLEEALAAVDKRVVALEKSSGGASENGLPGGLRVGGDLGAVREKLARFGAARGGLPTSFYTTLDDAAKDLDLTDRQKQDFERAMTDARRDFDELHKIQDDEGKTWDDVQRDTFKMDGGGFKLDTTKLTAFKAKTVPGRSETFGQADARIRADAKSRMRSTLTNDQQAKFDKANVDPMLGTGSGTSISFITSEVVETK